MTKLLNTVATRIQSRLKRQGIVNTLGDIKDYLRSNVINIENITKSEETSATEHFINNVSQLAVITGNLPIEETAVEELETNSTLQLFEDITGDLNKNVDIVNSVDSSIDTPSVQDIDSSELYTNKPALDTENQTALATATKSELVASSANSLGVVLNTSEIELIASNFNSSSEDLTDSLEEIKSAIVAFIQYKVSLNSQKISETLEEISQVAADGFSQNSEQLTTGLQGINSQLQEQTKNFKSKVKSTLAAFKVPSLKAG